MADLVAAIPEEEVIMVFKDIPNNKKFINWYTK